MPSIGFELRVDNADLLKNATDEEIKTALSAIGQQAEGFAKMKCRVDTGLLRNSITWAIQGGEADSKEYHNNSTHADTEATRKAGTAGKKTKSKRGVYSGHLETGQQYAVAVGSNVAYAAYVEMGHSSGQAYPFLEPAIRDHLKEYQQLLEEYLAKVDV